MKQSLIKILAGICVILLMIIAAKYEIYQNKQINAFGIEERKIDIKESGDNNYYIKDHIIYKTKTKRDVIISLTNGYNMYLLKESKISVNNKEITSGDVLLSFARGKPEINLITDSKIKDADEYVIKIDAEYLTRSEDISIYTDAFSINHSYFYSKNCEINIETKDSKVNTNLPADYLVEKYGNVYKYVIPEVKPQLDEHSAKRFPTYTVAFNPIENGETTEEPEVKVPEFKEDYNLKRELAKKEECKEVKKWLINLFAVTDIVFLVFLVLNIEISTKEYNKDFSTLISTTLAEAVIDGKFNLKNLIMSTIINLNVKGNIEIIDNDTIEYINDEDVEDYEKTLLEILFRKTRTVKFRDINNIFIESNDKTNNFAEKVKSIKKEIIDELLIERMVSTKGTFLNNLLSLAAILLIVNFILIFTGFAVILDATFYINAVTIAAYSIINVWGRKNESIRRILYRIRTYFLIISVLMTIAFFEKIVDYIKFDFSIILISLAIVALSATILLKKKNIILTSRGRKERLKLIKLRNYINQYSLIKDRDLKSTVIWDEYLAYATAFGIPNRVTSTLCESWYNLNITLQFLGTVLLF